MIPCMSHGSIFVSFVTEMAQYPDCPQCPLRMASFLLDNILFLTSPGSVSVREQQALAGLTASILNAIHLSSLKDIAVEP